MKGHVATALAVGAVVATGLASAGPDALVPLRETLVSAVEVSVAIVVDFGATGVVEACVKVPDGDNGSEALQAFTEVEHEMAPTYSDSGLLCSIDNVPDQSGSNPPCGQEVPGGYEYWSYWHGTTGSWVYASTGPGDVTVTDGDVEGWRWEDPGAGNPSDRPPQATPDFNAICGPTASTTTSITGPVTTAPVASSTPPSNSVSPSTVSGGNQPSTSAGGDTAPAGTTVTSVGDIGGPKPSTASTPSKTRHNEGMAASVRKAPRSGGSSWSSLIVTGAILATLAGAAGFRWRRRPRTS